ncbi:hypothetical protein K458DRAFT_393491 [Lentithecium fluviatile CBS 122367]|uniref:Uncharacterized protein n=1 Tax=Lentithecium fluviatile CBS 122367 TaxID=1168545 RepID=A0A6G1IPA3_9PLEO|nr:hypothetical protein K458DRAFT_393491 [Lentithecium fluviatile CBS 122367]
MKLSHLLSFATSTVAATISTRSNPYDSSETPNFGYEELYKLQTDFYNRFQYPNNIKEAESINSTVFSEDVQGRVSDTRNFVGRELNTEYIFGLFTPSDSLTIIGRPVGPYEIIQFAANQNIASATTRINFIFPSFGNISLPITVDTWMTWNAARQVTQYDVTFRWFGYLLKTLLLSVDKDPVKAQAIATTSIAKSICSTHTKYCNGTNTQYESPEECYGFLTKEIRVGESFELGMDTLLCRNVHEIMVKFRPDVHCSHIGKTGGGQCDDTISYQEKVEEQYFTNSPWKPTKY